MATKAQIQIRPINIETMDITIVGTTPLIVHAWSHKAKQEMLDKQRGKKVSAKHSIKIPVNDFMDSLYWLTEKPEPGIDDDDAESKWAYRAGLDVKQTELRGTFFLEGLTDASTIDLAEIVGPAPEFREDMVRVGGMSKTADIRHRAEFREWEIPLRLKYISDGKYSLEQILNMVNYGGFVCGIGEWRPEKDGQFGMYAIKTS